MGKQDRKSAARAISDSAQKIWLAGLGAFAKAQEEGSRVFEQLISEGAQLDARTREETRGQLDELRGQMEGTVERLRQSGLASLERVQALIDQRVAEAIERMAVPSRSDFDQLASQLAAMTERFTRDMTGGAAGGQRDNADARGGNAVVGRTPTAHADEAMSGKAAPARGGTRAPAPAAEALPTARGRLQSQGSLAPARRKPSVEPRASRASTATKAAAVSNASKASSRATPAPVRNSARGTSTAAKAGAGRNAGAVKTTAAGKPARPPKKGQRR